MQRATLVVTNPAYNLRLFPTSQHGHENTTAKSKQEGESELRAVPFGRAMCVCARKAVVLFVQQFAHVWDLIALNAEAMEQSRKPGTDVL